MPDRFLLPLGGSLVGRLERRDDVATLALRGDFDLAGVEAFEATLESVVATGPRAVVLDVQELDFLDSCAIRAIYDAHLRAEGSHAFVLLNGSGPAHRALTLTGMQKALTMVDSPEQLLEAARRQDPV